MKLCCSAVSAEYKLFFYYLIFFKSLRECVWRLSAHKPRILRYFEFNLLQTFNPLQQVTHSSTYTVSAFIGNEDRDAIGWNNVDVNYMVSISPSACSGANGSNFTFCFSKAKPIPDWNLNRIKENFNFKKIKTLKLFSCETRHLNCMKWKIKLFIISTWICNK